METEKQLIRADTVLKGIKAFKQCYKEHVKELSLVVVDVACIALTMVERFVENTPTVDAVEVVRCKECKYRHTRTNCHGRPMDFFCADGKRK